MIEAILMHGVGGRGYCLVYATLLVLESLLTDFDVVIRLPEIL